MKVISESELLNQLFGEKHYLTTSYDTETEAIKKYVADNNFHYYAKPNESFSLPEAIKEATDLKKAGVIVDNLS